MYTVEYIFAGKVLEYECNTFESLESFLWGIVLMRITILNIYTEES
jgi:hypothetical protein